MMPTYWYAFHCCKCTPSGKHVKIETDASGFLNEHRRLCPYCHSQQFQPLFGRFPGQSPNPPEAYKDSRPAQQDTRPVWKMEGAISWKNREGGMLIGGDGRVDISGAIFADNGGADLEVTGDATVTGTGVHFIGKTLNDT